jgi:hypothetical protein
MGGLAKQGRLLITMFNYNSVIKDSKEHLGITLIKNMGQCDLLSFSRGGPCIRLNPVEKQCMS